MSNDPTGAPAASIYQATRVDKPWGHEIIYAAVKGKYIGKLIHVSAGHALSLQYHQAKEETISVVSGTARIDHGLDAESLETVTLDEGATIHLPPPVLHRITAVTDLVFAESSTAGDGWNSDVVRLEDRYGRTGTNAP